MSLLYCVCAGVPPSPNRVWAQQSCSDRAHDRRWAQKKTRRVIVHPSPSAPQPVPDTNITVGFQSHDIHTCEGTGPCGYRRWGGKRSQGACRGMDPLCFSEKPSKSKVQCEWGRQDWLCKSADSHSWAWGQAPRDPYSLIPSQCQPAESWRHKPLNWHVCPHREGQSRQASLYKPTQTDRCLSGYEKRAVLLIHSISRIHSLSGCKVRWTLDR